MNQMRLIPVAVLTAALIGSPGLPTFMSSVDTAVAEGMPEEEVMTKQRGKKRSRGQVSRPSSEKKKQRKKRRRSRRIRSRGIESPPPVGDSQPRTTGAAQF
jgi:hypothetical protein